MYPIKRLRLATTSYNRTSEKKYLCGVIYLDHASRRSREAFRGKYFVNMVGYNIAVLVTVLPIAFKIHNKVNLSKIYHFVTN